MILFIKFIFQWSSGDFPRLNFHGKHLIWKWKLYWDWNSYNWQVSWSIILIGWLIVNLRLDSIGWSIVTIRLYSTGWLIVTLRLDWMIDSNSQTRGSNPRKGCVSVVDLLKWIQIHCFVLRILFHCLWWGWGWGDMEVDYWCNWW